MAKIYFPKQEEIFKSTIVKILSIIYYILSEILNANELTKSLKGLFGIYASQDSKFHQVVKSIIL